MATTETSSRAATPSAALKTEIPNGAPSKPSGGAFNAPRGRMGMSIAVPSAMSTSTPIPLSARKSPCLDLNTVERRGQPNCPKPEPKQSRPHGLQEAPTFRPTEEEFRNGPIDYIRSIEVEGRKYGIVKIVPPDGWNPDFAIDTERFHFRTRKQELNLADGGTRANLNYLDALAKFHKIRSGANLNRFPSVDKRPLDLYKLKKFVEDKGGFDNVCRGKRWAEIGRDLGYSGKIMSSLSTSLKNSYQKWLQPYEDYLRENRPGVLQQQEKDHGGPYTPSPSQTPAKSAKQSPAPGSPSPVQRASAALSAALQESPAPKIESPPPSGFAAVNAVGFKAVNAPSSGFSAINGPPPRAPRPTTPISGKASAAPDAEPSRSTSIGAPRVAEIQSEALNPLKRQHSADDLACGDSDGSGRRSKRQKKDGAPTVTGSHMIQPRISAPKSAAPRDRSNDKPGDCEVCGKGGEVGATLLCDSCDSAYHLFCLDPPIKSAPDSDWHCHKCLVGTGEFGFEEGGIYSLKQFQEKAHSFKDRHFAAKAAEEGSMIDVSEEEVELEFWRLTESLTETVEVEYGADIHSTTHGSGFPTIERRPFSPYSTDPWNLNVLPLDKDSLFRHIKTDISGMTVPWLYVGMCFSTFCWHNEDHYTYSANYQHFGDTKTWYGIPSGDSERFEAAMQEAVPELFEQQPDLLFQLVTLLQPEKLVKSGVQVYALDQRAGEFVITFPQAYHAGFNHGFNFNEAVNFAPSDWEPFGGAAIQRLRDFRRQPVFSHDELLFSAAKRDHSIKTSKWLAGALDRVVRAEILSRDDFHDIFQDQQKKLVAQGAVVTEKSLSYLEDATDIADEEIVCAYCKSYGYLSRLICINSQRVVCLKHAGTYDCCSADEGTRIGMMDGRHCLRFRMTNGDLEKIVKKVMDIAKTPDVWQDKVDALLEDEPTPSLKALRALVGEGERIDASWPLPGLVDLRVYVARCNAWVEEATAFIARKPNRRKSEFRVRLSGSDEVRKKPDREEARREMRNPDSIKRLLNTAIELSFDCPEREKLQERYDKICEFRKKARSALNLPHITETELDELLEEGKELDVDLPEIKSLDTRGRTVRWFAEAKELSEKLSHGKMNPDDPMSLDDVTAFIERGKNLEIMENDQYMKFFLSSRDQGEFWTNKTREVMGNEHINYTQLNALWEQARRSPVDKTILAQIDGMLKKQREAQEKIMYLYERTKERVFQNRPTYKEVRETMEAVDKLNSKPPGTLDLEREQRRHEDWMRRGKKLFGKANAPLHILLQHMQHVRERNEACLDLKDEPRGPVEPASREVTPDFATANGSNSIRDVFCICRKPESGMMIECELCHEWYHGRCLKIARGKVKEDDKYTCPICDYRLKIPRDAARPRLEDLQFWQEDIPMLPFQPDEEEVLASIIDTAVKFREYIQNIIAPIISTPDDLTNQRFYLRKVEGADVLLVDETNYLRQQLHRWAPVAPEPPKGIEVSLSTRKPRPTKVQKLMTQLGVNSIQEVPEHLRPKISRRRVINNASGKGSNPERPSGAAKPGESVNPWSFDRRPPSLTLGAPDLPIELMDSPSSPRSSTMTTPGGAFDGRFGGDDVGSQPRPGGLPTGTLDTKDLMRGVNTEFRGGRDEKRRDSTGGTGTGPSRSSERDFERRASAGGERRGSAMSPSAMGPGDAADRHRGESGGRQFQFRGGAGSLPLESPRLTQPPRAWNDDRFAAGGQPEHRRGSMGQRSAETSPSTEQQGFGMVDPALVSPTNMRAMQHPSPHSHHGHHARVGSMDSAGSARRVSVGGYGGSMSGGNVDPSLDNMFGPPAPAQQAPGQAMAGAAAEAPMALDDGGPLEDARMMMDERNSTEDLFGSLTNGAGAEGEEFSFAPAGGFEEEERRY